jgi:hypothetical protein
LIYFLSLFMADCDAFLAACIALDLESDAPPNSDDKENEESAKPVDAVYWLNIRSASSAKSQ